MREEKPPRQWALEISQLPTPEERRARLDDVPENLRPIVKTHLTNKWEHKKFLRRKTTTCS